MLAVTILILEERIITMYATASATGETVDILLVTRDVNIFYYITQCLGERV